MPRGAGAQVQDVWVLERALLPGGLSRWRASAQISLPPVRPPREPLRRRLARALGWQPHRPAELTAGAGAERAPLGRAPPGGGGGGAAGRALGRSAQVCKRGCVKWPAAGRVSQLEER